MTAPRPIGRGRAYLEFLAAIGWYFVAGFMATHAAAALVREAWEPITRELMLVFLLIAGYAFMGRNFDRQTEPVSEQGLPRREGWLGEIGLGLATGWTLALISVLPMTLIGGIAIVLNLNAAAWGWLLIETCYFALLALAEELFLRGYGFQRFSVSLGPFGATLGFALLSAIYNSLTPGSNHASFAVSLVFSMLLSVAYLRTRALWLGWGINFGWKASRALVFGLTIAGVNTHSPVVQGNPMGPFWLTGGGFGIDASWFVFAAMVAAMPVLLVLTRELDFRWNAPVLIPGGLPVEIDAPAAHWTQAAPAAPAAPASQTLIQIQPAIPVAPPAPQEPPTVE